MRTFLCLLLVASSALADAPAGTSRWHRVVGLLQYLEGDYPNALASGSEEEFAEQRAMVQELHSTLEALGAEGATWQPGLQQLDSAIAEKHPGPEVAALARGLARDVSTAQHLAQSPRHTPDLTAGRATWKQACATCHGDEGRADTPVAKGLTPPPANFHDADRMLTLTPYKVFNTTTWGITGTGMAAFADLAEGDRWNLAFLVMSLRQPKCETQPPAASLQELATLTDAQLAEKYSLEAVPCLRRVMPTQDDRSVLSVASAGLDEALRLSHAGQHTQARQALIDAYLTGFEPLEPALKMRNPQLLAQVEHHFGEARNSASAGKPIDDEVQALRALFTSVETRNGTGDFWSVFTAALLILIREGFEATVVVGALLALMKKMNATQHVRVVHAGWISALIAGALAFVFGHAFFAGANREWLETSVALAAVVMLLYAALWLNARATMSRFMTEMREKMKEALGRESMFGLFFISFSSVGRESIETVLFLEGLAGDSREGALWGASAGLAVLLGLVLLVRKVGYVLPMKTLFSASTVLLVVTAIALLGKGVHGLQELGVLSPFPLPFVQVDPLGLFPDAKSLGAQLLLTLLVLGYVRVQKTKRRPA